MAIQEDTSVQVRQLSSVRYVSILREWPKTHIKAFKARGALPVLTACHLDPTQRLLAPCLALVTPSAP
jgi:hypothetical protein